MVYFLRMKTGQIQIQKPILAPTLQQSIEILVLPITELDQAIEQELQNNPLLEIKEEKKTEPLDPIGQNVTDRKTADYDLPAANFPERNAVDHDFNEDGAFKQESSLEDDLLRQLKCETSDLREIKIGEFIIGNIDEDGYLRVTIEEINRALKISDPELIHKVLKIIQSAEPLGIAARDLKECLLIQAETRISEANGLAQRIIRDCLEELGKKHYAEIAKQTKTPLDQVKSACAMIATLDPRPARNYRAVKTNIYIKPDVSILKNSKKHYLININRDGIPQLTVNSHYKAMLKQASLSAEERQFIREKLTRAINFIKSIDQRYQTIQAISEFILEKQKDFFEKGPEGLAPMNLKEIAAAVDRNESTISRALKDKYIETPHGIFPFKFFFSQALSSQNHEDKNGQVANRSIKEEIAELIGQENKSSPLSDQDIQKHFESKGVKIARRTIAKYRNNLNILPTHLRKR